MGDKELSRAEFASFMKSSEAITCTKEIVKERCPNPCQVGRDIEKDICQAIHFGYGSGGKKIEWTVDKILRKTRTNCNVQDAIEACDEVEWEKCNADEKKEDICKLLHSGEHSAQEVSGIVGGALGMFCTAEELQKLCVEE